MSESNDRAFITISKELVCLRNDLVVLQKFQQLMGYMNHAARESIRSERTDRLHSEGFQGMSKLLGLIGDSESMNNTTKRLKGRIEHLETLSEAYMNGRDIVAMKLAQDPTL